jgi:aspartate aminotransferase-like enzyme
MNNKQLIFKRASEDSEFEAIHHLNYKTFVEEIPQHAPDKQHKLIDKFHEKNTYIICLQGKTLLGMICVNDKRPFSLDAKLDNIERYLPAFSSICEIRLLAIEAKNRHSKILVGLFQKFIELAAERKYELGVISGLTKQLKLYQHVGFKPFGPVVGTKEAPYQPMYTTLADIKQALSVFNKKQPIFNYLPGPVTIHPRIMKAYAQLPCSHREAGFMADFAQLQDRLSRYLKTKKVYITTGSGTLANDIIAAQLSILSGKGLVLVNGEFGKRLVDHARCAELDYDHYMIEEGLAFTEDTLNAIKTSKGTYRWLWVVHCETSTGVLNDVESIQAWCKQQNILLCLDIISTIAVCPVDLSDVYLASASSGKGIGSLPGLALVFSAGVLNECNRLLPPYLNLARYESAQGIPYTLSSNAVYALITALQQNWLIRCQEVEQWSNDLRAKLQQIGLNIVAERNHCAPHITTIVLPKTISSLALGKEMADAGILISYASHYLLENNWIQICFMGDCQQTTGALIDYLNVKGSTSINIEVDPLKSIEKMINQ